jgi:hypothetical protein
VSGGTLVVVPVLHGRLEFAVAVRQAIEAVRPACIAVELPETLEGPILRGIARLPLLSVVVYRDPAARPVYLPIEPADPCVEALRSGLERGLPVHLVDRDVDRYERHADPLPDPYAARRIGPARYAAAVEEALAGAPRDPSDEGREAVMAFHLGALLARHPSVLFVCGLAHARRVRELVLGGGGAAGGGGEPIRRVKREAVTLYHLSAPSSREVMAEIPYLSLAYERARAEGVPALDRLDRLERLLELAREARERSERERGEAVSASALATMFRFARNYALVEGGLAPDLYQLLVAARGAVDDDFAYEVWDLATTWPHQSESPGLPVIELSIEDLFEHARYIRFHRTQRSRRRRLLRLVKDRPREERPGEWRESWQGEAICSYPPEDVVVESYGDFLKKRARGLLSAERARVEPFLASLLDGIDVRETLRNWHEGRLYVREHQVFRGQVGAVVVVFDEDPGPVEKYTWKMTWQGEHAQESDMALYSTPPSDRMVGPGISRCEYGGFLLTSPPGRMFHVFEDPYFDRAESKPERLLMAGIDYSLEKLLVYVAARPPRSALRALAERHGRKVVYIPLGDLSPVSLKQVRTFHVLDGHPVRAYAKGYI